LGDYKLYLLQKPNLSPVRSHWLWQCDSSHIQTSF